MASYTYRTLITLPLVLLTCSLQAALTSSRHPSLEQMRVSFLVSSFINDFQPQSLTAYTMRAAASNLPASALTAHQHPLAPSESAPASPPDTPTQLLERMRLAFLLTSSISNSLLSMHGIPTSDSSAATAAPPANQHPRGSSAHTPPSRKRTPDPDKLICTHIGEQQAPEKLLRLGASSAASTGASASFTPSPTKSAHQPALGVEIASAPAHQPHPEAATPLPGNQSAAPPNQAPPASPARRKVRPQPQGGASAQRSTLRTGRLPRAGQENRGALALHRAAGQSSSIDDAEALMCEGFNGNQIDRNGQTVFHYMVQNPHRTLAHMRSLSVILVKAGGDINGVDTKGNTALHAAVNAHNTAAVQALLERSARTDLHNHAGHTALDSAQIIGAPAELIDLLECHEDMFYALRAAAYDIEAHNFSFA